MRAQCDFCPLLGSVNELARMLRFNHVLQYEDKGLGLGLASPHRSCSPLSVYSFVDSCIILPMMT